MNEANNLAEKLQQLERKFSSRLMNKPFKFFALFLREDNQKWDLVVSAQWIDQDVRAAVELLVAELKLALNDEEVLMLSRIVPYPTSAKIPTSFAQAISAEHSLVEIKDSNFFGIAIKHAFVITSHR